jgi:hypothetical protein
LDHAENGSVFIPLFFLTQFVNAMLRKIFFSFVVSCFVLSAVAQNKNHYAWGPIIGVSTATLTSTHGTISPRNGMVFGLFSDYRFNRTVGFEPEIDYSMQGAYDGNQFVRINYLNIPLMVKMFVTDRFNFQLGPQLAFCLNANGNAVDSDGNPYPIQSISDINPLDFDLAVGLGYEFNKGLMVQARYFMGVVGVDKRGTLLNDLSFNKHNLNSVFQLMLGWKF